MKLYHYTTIDTLALILKKSKSSLARMAVPI